MVFKVLHGPSLKRYLYGQVEDLVCSPGPNGLEALRFAIYYAATTSMTAAQCLMQMGEERPALLIRYRASVEVALAKADFVNTVELSTLQALAIFLVSLHTEEAQLLPSPPVSTALLTTKYRLPFAATTPLGYLGRF
jgi:hypothetical protein